MPAPRCVAQGSCTTGLQGVLRSACPTQRRPRGTAATSRMSRVAGVCACSSCRHACSRSRRTRLRVGARP